MNNKPLLLLGICAIALGGCSSRPRNFAPVLAAAPADARSRGSPSLGVRMRSASLFIIPALLAAPADARAYEKHWLDCREEVAATTGKGSGWLASAGGGAVAGAGAGLAASAAASGATYGTVGAAAAAAGAMMIATVPVFGLAGAWGISKIKKSKNERRVKAATAECMARNGYSVEKWRVMSKREVRALEVAQPATDPAAQAPSVAEPR